MPYIKTIVSLGRGGCYRSARAPLLAIMPSPRGQCHALDTPTLVNLVPLAELEGLGAVVELFGCDHALVREEALERGEPALVVTRGFGLAARRGDLVDEAFLELLPGVEPLVVERHGHAEDAPCPRRIEDQLAILAGRGDGAFHIGHEPARLEIA